VGIFRRADRGWRMAIRQLYRTDGAAQRSRSNTDGNSASDVIVW
jgi:hypothetical protein